MPKPGPKKRNYHGFDNVVNRVKRTIVKHNQAILVYVKGTGFVVLKKVLEKLQKLIDDGNAELVCTYDKDVDYYDVAEDCVWTLDQMILQGRRV